jgi:hypothetical protein
MEMSDIPKKSFKFENPLKSKIYDSLQRFIGEAQASFYKDSCKVMVGDCDLETKTNLVGHLLREIYGWILGYMLPAVGYTEPTGENNRVQKIKDAAKLFEIDEDSTIFQKWLKTTKDLHKKAHRDSMGHIQPVDESFVKIWNTSEEVFVFLLDKIEANYLSYTKQLDHFLNKKITAKDLSKIKVHIPPNQITLSYFFEKLDDPSCVKSLRKKGFFEFPKKPIVHEDGGVSYPHWPPMAYLVKISTVPEVQDEVLSICLKIETDNVNTQVQILDIALNLPADKSVQLTTKSIARFSQIKSWFHAEKYGKLFVHLAKSGFKKEALELASKLLAVQPNPRKPSVIEGHSFPHEPVALIDDWHYEEVLKNDFPSLVEVTGIDAIKILLDQIENYINLSDADREKGSKDDYSYIWRNAIEDSAQNIGENIRDTIINGARDSLELYLKNHPDEIEKIVAELESRKLNIFIRLSSHLLRLFPKGAEKLIAERLLNPEEFKDASNRLNHEYFLLAEAHSSLLDKQEREQVWSWIMNGADKEAYKQWRKKDYGVDVDDEEVQKYTSNWQMYHLMPFKDIDPAWQKYFEGLKMVLGEPIHPSFRSWTSSGSWGPNSIVSDKQLKKMSPNDVVEYLKNWVPEANDPLDRSREGTSRTLITQIAEDTDKWNDHLLLFSNLDPTYVRSVFIGFRDAVKQGKKFSWEPILSLAKTVLNKPIEIEGRKPSGVFGDDPDWNWCRHTIVEMLSEGLKEVAGQIPLTLRKETWGVIQPLTADPNPTPEYEEKYLASHPDPLSLAINTTRGDALDAAIQYGIWVKSSTPKEEHSKWRLAEKAPELLAILNDHLDIKKDPSVGIRAFYGEKLGQLGWLDEKWIRDCEDLIFPEDPELQKYFDAAWEAYITYVPAYDNLFKIIEKQYNRAIVELGKHTVRKHHFDTPEQSLSQHLTAYYWRGLIELETGLLADFYTNSSTDLKAEVIEFIGRICKNDEKTQEKVRERFVTLLEKRISELKKDGTSQDSIQELQSLSWWFASEQFENPWMLEKLLEALQMGCDIEGDHLIIERFANMTNQFPLLVIRCSRLMVENDKKGWGVVHWRDELRSTIHNVLNGDDQQAKKEAEEFVHRLGSRGHLEFSDLIK